MPQKELRVSSLSRVISFSWLKKSTIIETIAFLFVILFVYTGTSKLSEYGVFREQIAESPILKPVAPIVSWLLPITEFVVSLLLLIPRWRLKGLYASLALMVAFTLYVGAILSFSRELPCSCGGIIELLSWKEHLLFNSIFILLAITGIVLQRQLSFNNTVPLPTQ